MALGGAAPVDGAPPQLLRSIRWWLRAFPPRWRRVHERETTDLLLELAPERARRLDARTAAGLVAAGWGTRWRGRPSVGRYLGYRLELRAIDVAHREWARDDIESRWYPLRQAVLVPLVMAVVRVLSSLVAWATTGRWTDSTTDLFFPWMGFLPVYALAFYAQRRTLRRRAIVRHLLLRPGEPPSASVYRFAPVPRTRTSAAAALVQLAVAGGLLVISGVLTVVYAPTFLAVSGCDTGNACFTADPAPISPAIRLGIAGVALLVMMVVATRLLVTCSRAARNLAVRPAQPARSVIRIRGDIAPWAVAGLVVGLAWQAAEIVEGWSLVAGPVCLTIGGLLLVWAAVGRWVIRHGQGPDTVDEPVAWVDVWRTMHRTELLIDQPVEGFVLASGAATTSPATFPAGCVTGDGTRVG